MLASGSDCLSPLHSPLKPTICTLPSLRLHGLAFSMRSTQTARQVRLAFCITEPTGPLWHSCLALELTSPSRPHLVHCCTNSASNYNNLWSCTAPRAWMPSSISYLLTPSHLAGPADTSSSSSPVTKGGEHRGRQAATGIRIPAPAIH